MPSGTHCWKHDVWYSRLGQCPRCLAEESAERQREHFERLQEAAAEAQEREEEGEREGEREYEADRERDEERQREVERRHDELVRLREDEIYKRQNPGDYECPECLYITLKRGASRCPTCHAVIRQDHWPPIYEAERLAKERLEAEARRRAEEWQRGRPERERQAEHAAAEARRREKRAAAEAKGRRIAQTYFGYLLPILAWTSVRAIGLVAPPGTQSQSSADQWILLVPVLNWVSYLGLLIFGGPNRPLAWTVFAIWAAAGVLTLLARGAARRP